MRFWKPFTLCTLFALLMAGGYVLAAQQTCCLGFPLDDAWIHQTYARNLAWHGEWAFVPGKPSAGSTSPLWSALLVPGHWLPVSPVLWTMFLGVVLLSLLGCLTWWGLAVLVPGLPAWWRVLGAILLMAEWHMAWAAVSGMETLLSALWVTALLLYLLGEGQHWGWVGACIGLGVWVRPDSITLAGPAFVAVGLSALRLAKGDTRRGARLAWRALGVSMAGFGLIFAPYLFLNRWISDTWWPNTFYAKQQEYTALWHVPFLQRYLMELRLPLTGIGVLLLPGVLYLWWQAARQRRWMVLAASVWFLGYAGLYAWRLPVTYQHGRYMMPAMPIFFLMGLAGAGVLYRQGMHSPLGRVLVRAWLLSLLVVGGLFGFLGARAYGRDVAVIQSEMVAAAQWVRAHTPQGSLVAAHDIGALGYFGERELLDLAGLVSPEVIPFLRDERALAKYLDARGAAYLVTFPGWYPHLVQCGRLVYRSTGAFAPALGAENMAVYRWEGACISDE